MGMQKIQKIRNLPLACLGFTLVEILVASAIFTASVSALGTLFNYSLKINRRTDAIRQASQGMRNLVELIVKEVRNGQIYYGVDNSGTQTYGGALGPCNSPTMSSLGLGKDRYTGRSNWLFLLSSDGGFRECIYFADSAGNAKPAGTFTDSGGQIVIEKEVSGGVKEIFNPPNFVVENLVFLVRPTCDPYTQKPPGCSSYGNNYPRIQPFVQISIKFVAKLGTGEQVPIYYQTAASSNKYDIPSD